MAVFVNPHRFGSAVPGPAAAPVFVSAGTAGSGLGSADIRWPTHQVDDIGIVIVKTTNQALPATPTGCTPIFTPTGIGTPGAAGAVRLHAYWIRATSSAMPLIATGDSGDMQLGVMLLFRGCVATGSPIDATASDTAGSSTSVTVPGLTTSGDKRMIVACCGLGSPDANSTANASGFANASLVSIAEIADRVTSAGFGGGWLAACGEKSLAGAVAATTATVASASLQERLCFALTPA